MAAWDIGQIERIVQSVVQAALTSSASTSSRHAPRSREAVASGSENAERSRRNQQQNTPPPSLQDTVAVSPEARKQLVDAMLRDLVRALTASTGSPTAPAPAPPAEAMSALLENADLRRQLVQLLAQEDVRARLPQLLRDPASQHTVLRLLQNEAFSPAVRSVFASPDAKTLVRLLISQSSTRSDALTVLSKNNLLNQAVSSLQPLPEVQVLEGLANLPEGRQLIVRLMGQSTTMREQIFAATGQFADPLAPSALLADPNVQGLSKSLLGQPEIARAYLDLLSRSGSGVVKDQVFARSDVQGTLPMLLSSPETQRSALELLGGASPDTVSQILGGKDIQAAIASLLGRSDDPEVLSASLRLLNQAGTSKAAAAILVGANVQTRIAEYLDLPQVRPEAIRFIEGNVFPTIMRKMMPPAQAQEFLQRLLSDPETFGAAARILSQPSMGRQIDARLSEPHFREMLPALITNEGTNDNAILLLLAARNSAAAREILSTPEIQAALGRVLVIHPKSQALIELLTRPGSEAILLQSLSGIDDKALLNQILKNSEVQQQLATLLQNDATREAALQILSRLGPSSLLNQIFSRPDVQAALLLAVQNGQSLAELRQILQSPQMRGVVQEMLARLGLLPNSTENARNYLVSLLSSANLSPGMAQAMGGSGARDSRAMEELHRMLAPGLLPRETIFENPRADSALLDRLQSNRVALLELQAGTSSNLRLVLQRLFGALSTFAASGLGAVGVKTLRKLERSLARLQITSPERASSALRTLSFLSRIGGRNLDEVLLQISEKLERLSDSLALKGGLAASLREPNLPETSLLMLRFSSLPRDSFIALVRLFIRQGMEIVFVGRDGAGAAQIQIQMAELSSESPERAQQNGQPAILLAGLRMGEADDLARLFVSMATPRERDAHSQSRNPHSQDTGPRGQAAGETAAASGARQVLQSAMSTGTGDNSPVILRADGIAQFAYNYHMAALAPFANIADSPISIKRAAAQARDKDHIPSFLELIADEPLLLPYYPNEILIPGTNIPLILPRESGTDEIQDAEILPS